VEPWKERAMGTVLTERASGARSAEERPRRAAGRRRRGEAIWGYLFLAPWFTGLVVLTIGPVVYSLYLSFTDFDLLTSPSWIGVDNYVEMFTADERFWRSVVVTVTYAGLSVPLKLGLALGVAMLLNRGLRGLGLYRAIFYLPSLLGGSVAIAVMWRQLFGDQGLFNRFLGLFGIPGHAWISEPDTALYTLIVLAAWQFGTPMVIFLAGLKQLPRDVYEAAAVDGARPWTRFWRITVPLLSPIIFFNLVLEIINTFQSFTSAFVVSGGTGGPVDSTLLYTLYLYKKGFANLHMGYAAAMAWVLFAVIAGLTAVNFVASRYWVHYEDRGA
jgi:multiple sugar transport system permease protein